MGLSVDYSGWQVRQNVGGSAFATKEPGGDRLGDELTQNYDFSSPEVLWQANGSANLQINCRLEKGLYGLSVNTFLNFYFRPFRLTEDTSLILRLYAADGARLAEVPVLAESFSGFQDRGSDWVAGALIGSKDENRMCLTALLSGQQLHFLLFKEKPFNNEAQRKEFEEFCVGAAAFVFDQFVKLPLPPDKVFKEVYEESYLRILHAEDPGTGRTNLFGDEADNTEKEAPKDSELDVIVKLLHDKVWRYKDTTKLSWALIMPTVQANLVKLYVRSRGIEGARKHLEEIIAPLQKQFGPINQTFSDTATLEISYSHLPQFILFNAQFGELITKLRSDHAIEQVAEALVHYLVMISAQAVHPAVGVKMLTQSCRDLQSGSYAAFDH